MFAKLAKLGGLAASISTTAYAEQVIETPETTKEPDEGIVDLPSQPEFNYNEEDVTMRLITAGENPSDLTKAYQFSVISFFKTSDYDSMVAQEMIESGMRYLTKKVRIGDWSKRNIGWFKVDLDVTPELSLLEDKTMPNQAVIGPGLHRMTHFDHTLHENSEDNEMQFALTVRELTGDWI